MMLGVPQGDPALRQFMLIAKEFFPRSTLTSYCTLGCTPYCCGCKDVDLPQLRRVRESDCMEAVPMYDPFVLLVDGKHQPTGKHFAGPGKIAVGLYHPFSGATRVMSSKEATLQEGDGPCGSVVDPNPGQIQMAAEHLAISMGAEFFFAKILISAWQHMRSTVPTANCQSTRLSQTPQLGLVQWSATLETQGKILSEESIKACGHW